MGVKSNHIPGSIYFSIPGYPPFVCWYRITRKQVAALVIDHGLRLGRYLMGKGRQAAAAHCLLSITALHPNYTIGHAGRWHRCLRVKVQLKADVNMHPICRQSMSEYTKVS
jgi:hypothetical protein